MPKIVKIEKHTEPEAEDRFWHPVGLTALMYLREALQEENYEECADIIRLGREFGVYPWEITNVLKAYASS